MYIGIIAEGKGDLAVITNILKGKLSVDKSDVEYLQPELDFDETESLSDEGGTVQQLGNCQRNLHEKKKIIRFFQHR